MVAALIPLALEPAWRRRAAPMVMEVPVVTALELCQNRPMVDIARHRLMEAPLVDMERRRVMATAVMEEENTESGCHKL